MYAAIDVQTRPAAPRSIESRPLVRIALLLAYVALILLLQVGQGAYRGEFDNDDASHLVSSLLLHDWILSGKLRGALDYALAYHAHYPLVGIGHWGPAWYVVEAGWMLLAGTGKQSVLLSCALTTAALSTLLALAVARRINLAIGLIAGALFAAAGSVAISSSSLMLDVPIALACFAASLCFAAYLKRHALRWILLFACFAAFALLIKGNAAALVLFVGFTVLAARRIDLLLRPSFWSPVVVIGILAGPWYYKSYGLVAAGFRHEAGFAYVRQAVPANLAALLLDLGPIVLALALVGAWRALRNPDDRVGVSAVALAASILVFQCLMPAALQPRYMIPALPPLLLLAADGAVALFDRLRRGRVAGAAVAFLLVCCWAAGGYLLSPKRPHWNMQEASERAASLLTESNPVALVVGDNDEESAGITELAWRDPKRPSWFAVRGSRLLGGGGYNRGDYQPRFATLDEVRTALDEYRVPVIILSASLQRQEWAHVTQVSEIVHADEQWQRVWQAPADGRRDTSVWVRRDVQPAEIARLLALSAPRLGN